MSGGIVVRRIAAADYARSAAVFAELARRAAEPNPAMATASVVAALERVAPAQVVILAAWLSEALGSERLVGLWALRRQNDWRSGFAAVLSSPLRPFYEVSSAPVLDRDHADDVASALLRHILAASDLPSRLSLPLLPLEGATYRALAEACRTSTSRIRLFETWQRPVVVPSPHDTTEGYLRRALGAGLKRRMKAWRALGRAGTLSFQRRRGMAAREALETFLTLEAAGWKGEAGTAIACIPAEAAYFRKLAELHAAQDTLLVDALLLDGKPIAMGLLIDGAGTRQFLKIAYDERHARHSPGRSLSIAMLQADFAGEPPTLFDSGAGDGVAPATYVWGERRLMGNALIQLGSRKRGRPYLALAGRMLLRRLRARLRPKA